MAINELLWNRRRSAEKIDGPARVNVLFVCSRNRWRSPTAEQVFADYPGIACASAGLTKDAETPLSEDLLAWADIVFVMEPEHRTKITKRFHTSLKDKQLVCLDIPDHFQFMDERLVRLLEQRVTPVLERRLRRD